MSPVLCTNFHQTDLSTDIEDFYSELVDARTGHLSSTEIKFFKHWDLLISLEEKTILSSKQESWTLSSIERENMGKCWSGMIALPNGDDGDDEVVMFKKKDGEELGVGIGSGDPVMVSIENEDIAISKGFVKHLQLEANTVFLKLEPNFIKFHHKIKKQRTTSPIYRIDKDELAVGSGRLRDNISSLVLGSTPTLSKLRDLIINLRKPTFTHFPQFTPSSTLNEDQNAVLRKCLEVDDYALIVGMPGTGKSKTIAEVVKVLMENGKSVLLTSYTHSAVDNVLVRLKDEGVKGLRLGSLDKVGEFTLFLPLWHVDGFCLGE
jgi:DNA replication ATP-dependent helicase Dna2